MTPEQRIKRLEEAVGVKLVKESSPNLEELKKIRDWYQSQYDQGLSPKDYEIQKKFNISNLDYVLDYLMQTVKFRESTRRKIQKKSILKESSDLESKIVDWYDNNYPREMQFWEEAKKKMMKLFRISSEAADDIKDNVLEIDIWA